MEYEKSGLRENVVIVLYEMLSAIMSHHKNKTRINVKQMQIESNEKKEITNKRVARIGYTLELICYALERAVEIPQ